MLSPVWLTHLRETPDTAGKAAQIWKEKKGKNPFTNDFLVLKGSAAAAAALKWLQMFGLFNSCTHSAHCCTFTC